MTKINLTREGFRDWLRFNALINPKKVVGYVDDTRDPICRYLRTELGIKKSFHLDGDTLYFNATDDYYTLPKWVGRYWNHIDRHIPWGEKVTAERAFKAANR